MNAAGAAAAARERDVDRLGGEALLEGGIGQLRAPGVELEVGMEGFRDAVVWNPWAERCAALPDMPEDGYRRMLCIEAAAIDKPVNLAPGQSWSGRQLLAMR